MRNIRDYGAVGDGICLDTKAIQAAIDAGGMIYLPSGTYRTGTLYLKSNGGLHLAPGAVLVASHDRQDYNADDYCPQNRVFREEKVTGAHLMTAVGQENITIEGHGTIDGQGSFWMNESHMCPGWPKPENRDYLPNENRPGQMIFLCECSNVHITDVKLVNGPYWHLFLHGCEDVFVRGLTIRGARPQWTNDGIDIDCCSHVTVSDCIIDVGDDAITLRANEEPLLHHPGICENVVISNCILHSHRDYGVRIGVGSGLIRNCLLSNLDIEAPTLSGIGIMGMWSSEARYATRIEQISGSGIHIRAHQAFEIFIAPDDAQLPNRTYIRNICFSHVMLTQEAASVLRGRPDLPVQKISFSDVVSPSQEVPSSALFTVRDVSDLRIG